jgi:hypothetical protein
VGDHVEALPQKMSGPAAADDAGADDGHAADFRR